jgi:ketosteroid isomerase-like protein
MTRDAAIEFVSNYLRLVERRELDEATTHLAPGVVITFPGGRRFESLEDQVAASQRRFRQVRKTFERFDVFEDGDRTVVYVIGALQGEDLLGVPFSGVRFVDRLAIRSGSIIDHEVWNDLAESVLTRPPPSSSEPER